MTRREVEVDTQLAAIWERSSKATRNLEMALIGVHHALGERQGYGRTVPTWPTSNHEAEEKLRERVADESVAAWTRREGRDALARVEKYRAEIAACRDEAQPLNEYYAAKRWSRFFLVKNNNGHIHRDMACSTCRPTTMYGWLPELSGLTEKDAVEAHGPLLCSVCFPSAPVEWTVGKQAPAGCAGSGKFIEGKALEQAKAGRRYVTCPVCGETVAMTESWKIRKHKPKAA